MEFTKEEKAQIEAQRKRNEQIAKVGAEIRDLLEKNNMRLVIDQNSKISNPEIVIVSN